MAEITSIKTTKPPVESLTVKLTKQEALDLATAYQGYYGNGRTLAKVLREAAEGKTSVMSPVDAYLSSMRSPF